MALTSAQRIAISKKIIGIADENLEADAMIAQLDIEILKAQDVDNGNKSLCEDYNVNINPYQTELGLYNGDSHVELLEQHFLDAANKTNNASLFPNNNIVPTPSIADGIWKFYTPFSGGVAIGKNYDETFTYIFNELEIIGTIKNLISTIEAFDNMERSTGQQAIAGVNPGDPDIIQVYPIFRGYGTLLVTAVGDWKTLINNIFTEINIVDTDAGRIAQNTIAKADITDCVPVIETWEALDDYDTSHGETTIVGFYAHDYTLLNPTKFRDIELGELKTEVLAREVFVNARILELGGYLGSITTNPANGQILTATGLYGARFGFIDMRLNLITGSLQNLTRLQSSKQSQSELKVSNTNIGTSYATVIIVSKLRAPASGGKIIHVIDASGFSIGNSVYIVCDTQTELSGTITNIVSNTIYLSIDIPKYYTTESNARIYKTI